MLFFIIYYFALNGFSLGCHVSGTGEVFLATACNVLTDSWETSEIWSTTVRPVNMKLQYMHNLRRRKEETLPDEMLNSLDIKGTVAHLYLHTGVLLPQPYLANVLILPYSYNVLRH